MLGGSDQSYNQQTPVINKELAKSASVTISGSMTLSGGIAISVSVNNITSANIASVKLMAVVYEDLGTDEHHYLVRDIIAPTAIASLPPGIEQKYNLKSSYTGSTTNLKAVVYIQASTGEILQAALAKIQ